MISNSEVRMQPAVLTSLRRLSNFWLACLHKIAVQVLVDMNSEGLRIYVKAEGWVLFYLYVRNSTNVCISFAYSAMGKRFSAKRGQGKMQCRSFPFKKTPLKCIIFLQIFVN